MVKIEFHSHSNDDPRDYIYYSTEALIDECIAQGYHALAITLHGAVLDRQAAYDYAHARNFLLIPGVEKYVEGKEVLLYNVTPGEVSGKMTFSDLRRLRERKGEELLVIAPHPYFPGRQCLHSQLEMNIDLFDAIEWCNFYLPSINFNRRAAQIAHQYNKPLIATGDIHSLNNLGRCFCTLDITEPSLPAIFEAVRQGRFENTLVPLNAKKLCAGLFGIAHDKIRRLMGMKNH